MRNTLNTSSKVLLLRTDILTATDQTMTKKLAYLSNVNILNFKLPELCCYRKIKHENNVSSDLSTHVPGVPTIRTLASVKTTNVLVFVTTLLALFIEYLFIFREDCIQFIQPLQTTNADYSYY